MSTVEEFFTARGVPVDEPAVVAALAALLDDRLTAAGSVPLAGPEREVLERHAGVRPAPEDEAAAVAATAAAALDLAATALTPSAAATAAGVSASRVRHWIGEGAVHVLRVGGRNLLPAWQFGPDGRPLPHLGRVLAALPPDLHPLSVEGFFTTPVPELEADGRELAPADWLRGGGEPEVVVALAAGLHQLL